MNLNNLTFPFHLLPKDGKGKDPSSRNSPAGPVQGSSPAPHQQHSLISSPKSQIYPTAPWEQLLAVIIWSDIPTQLQERGKSREMGPGLSGFFHGFPSGVFGVVWIHGRSSGSSILFWKVGISMFVASLGFSTNVLWLPKDLGGSTPHQKDTWRVFCWVICC